MRRAQSYPCPFCNVTSEKRKTAQLHAEEHVPLMLKRIGHREWAHQMQTEDNQTHGTLKQKPSKKPV